MSQGLNEGQVQKNEEKEKKVERLWTKMGLLKFRILGVGFWILISLGSNSVELKLLEIDTDLTHREAGLKTL